MILNIIKEPNKNYQAYLVIAWETTRDWEQVRFCDEARYETVTTTKPQIFSCNTTEELVTVVNECKAKNWPHDVLKTTKATLKQTVTLDIEE